MEIELTGAIKEVIDVDFPVYTRSIASAWWFKSENECVEVSLNDCSNTGIVIHNNYPKKWLIEDTLIDKEEFNLALSSAFEKLKKELNINIG